jgi:hypothetical protein
MMSLAMSTEPLWFCPISPMMYVWLCDMRLFLVFVDLIFHQSYPTFFT